MYLADLMRECPGCKAYDILKLKYLVKQGQSAVTLANKYSQELFSKHNSNTEYLFLRGQVLCQMGNTEQGKKFFIQALQYDPDYKECQLAIKSIKKAEKLKGEASEAFKKEEFKEAIELFSECVEACPFNSSFNSTIYLNRAISQFKLKNNTEAIRDLNLAIELNDNYAKAYVKRGEINLAEENYDEAVRDFTQAKDIDPNGFGVRQKL